MRVLLLAALVAGGVCFAQGTKSETVRGTLLQKMGKPGVETANHQFIFLDGDEPTRGVLNDKRLDGMDFEAKGHFTAAGHFEIDPIHTRAMHIHKDGKLELITYWCDTCGIRTWTPGKCWCCQQETSLSLIDPETLPQ